MTKNGHVWATQWPTSSQLKIKFDPSLDRSWCKFFKIMKNHDPKNPPLGCNLGPKFSASVGSLGRKKIWQLNCPVWRLSIHQRGQGCWDSRQSSKMNEDCLHNPVHSTQHAEHRKISFYA